MINIYQDIATHDKLIFPSPITRILTHIHIPIPFAPLFSIMDAISWESMQRSTTQLTAKQPCHKSIPVQQEEATSRAIENVAFAPRHPSSSAPSSSSRVEASLVAILDQLQQMHANFGSCLNILSNEVCRINTELVVLLIDSYVLVALLLLPCMRSLQLVEMMMMMMFLARSMRMR